MLMRKCLRMTGSAGTAMDVIIYAIAFNRRGVWGRETMFSDPLP